MSTGSFRKKEDGSWEYHISAGRDPKTGKYRQVHRRGFATKKDAVEDAEQERRRVREIGYHADRNASFNDYATRWLEEFATHNTQGKPLAASTLAVYKIIVNRHLVPLLGRTKIGSLSRTHIKSYLASKRAEGLSETTVKHHYRLLCLIADAAVDDQLLPHNVVKRVKSPKTNSVKAKFLSEPEQASVMNAAKQWMTEENEPLRVNTGMAAYLALMTGLRRGELCALQWHDLVTRLDTKSRKERNEIRVQRAVEVREKVPCFKDPKSQAGFRNIAISSTVVEALRRHRLWQRKYSSWLADGYKDQSLILPDDFGGIVVPVVLSQRFASLAKVASVTASLHALRHTAVSNWIAAGMNAKAVQERAGHSSITVTMDVYGHLFESLSADQIETMDATILERLASAK